MRGGYCLNYFLKEPVMDNSDLIWHFTAPDALYHILSPKEGLLATHQAFMNDISDCELVRRINSCYADLLDHSIDAPDSKLPRKYVELKAGLRAGTHYTIFLACFSTTQNNPLLWRCYTSNGGFAIGISKEDLTDNLDLEKYPISAIRFEPCIYSKWGKVNKMVEDIEKDFKSRFSKMKKGTAEEKAIISMESIKQVLELNRELVFCKHPYFREEKEYRLMISFMNPVPFSDLIVLNGKPRVRVPLKVSFSSLVKHIYVSPLGDKVSNYKLAQILASSIGLPLSSVEYKDFPIR